METMNYKADGYGTSISNPTFEVCADRFNTKSHLKIGNMVIHNTHRFNWFHRKMWKLLLGFDVENV